MKDDCATFTSKGQLVIPVELRRKHKIKAGTKVKILEDQFGRIVLQPITDDYIGRVRGLLKDGPDLLASGKRNIVKKVSTINEKIRPRCQRANRFSSG